ncbi:MAG: AMP-binding protein [Aggregatilineales bacterium]
MALDVTYADKPWTKNYDSYVPETLAPYPEHPLHDYLIQRAKQTPHLPALITTAKLPVVGRMSSTLNYEELDRLSDSLAAGLIALGLKKGDRVVIVLPNCTAFAISYYAILKAGGVVAATNPTYPPAKMQYQINDCNAEIVITLSLFYQQIKNVQSETHVKHVIVTNIKEYMPGLAKMLFTIAREKKDGHRVTLAGGDQWFQEVIAENAGKRVNVDVKPDDLAIFQYTGGTTGVSKGAMSTHRALVANTTQIQAWTGISSGSFKDMRPDELLFFGAIPMFHAYGLIALLTQSVSSGAKIVLIPNPRDVDELVDVINFYKPNVFLGVPAMYNAVNNHPRVLSGEVSLKSFMFNSSGSAPLPPATKRDFETRSSGAISEGFGMSELPVATHSNPVNGVNKVGSIGIPLPDVEVRIVSLDDGETIMPPGDPGELIVHCQNMMVGYHNLPTETANTLRELEGKTWLYTGDVARMDEDGYFYLVDRKKDMALIGGFNVYPTSIEKVLKDHPAVLEVGVAAVPHPEKIGQESLKAWIVLQPGMSVTESELIKHCEQFLAPYEVPRRYGFIDELPKTIVGKTLRRELVRMEAED